MLAARFLDKQKYKKASLKIIHELKDNLPWTDAKFK